MKNKGLLLIISLFFIAHLHAQKDTSCKILAFYTGKNDLAHISFVQEANEWFSKTAKTNNFIYDTTSNWNKMNATILANYKIILFLDTRPEQPEQRQAFETYIKTAVHG